MIWLTLQNEQGKLIAVARAHVSTLCETVGGTKLTLVSGVTLYVTEPWERVFLLVRGEP